MFKKAVITDEITQDFDLALEIALKYGLDGVELRSVEELGPFEWTDELVHKMKSRVDMAGLEICCISSPFFKCELRDKEEIAKQYESLRRCVQHAKILDTKLIRGFTFWDKGDFEERLPEIVEQFSEVIKILDEADMIMVLENDPGVYAGNAVRVAKVVDAIASPRVQALWDPGNSLYDPDSESPYPHGYEIIKDKMVHVHLKDSAMIEGKPMGVPVSKGDVDFEGQFRRLIQDGYEGYVSLETHYRPAHLISKELLKMPKGSAFSHGGQEATEESLILWEQLMDKIKV